MPQASQNATVEWMLEIADFQSTSFTKSLNLQKAGLTLQGVIYGQIEDLPCLFGSLKVTRTELSLLLEYLRCMWRSINKQMVRLLKIKVKMATSVKFQKHCVTDFFVNCFFFLVLKLFKQLNQQIFSLKVTLWNADNSLYTTSNFRCHKSWNMIYYGVLGGILFVWRFIIVTFSILRLHASHKSS